MKQICFPVLVLFVISIRLAHSAEAPVLIERPASEAGPTEISVGIWIVDITNIDSAQQSFAAEIALVLRWKDSRLAHTGSGVVRYPLEQVWHPRVVIVNETNSVTHKFPESVEAEHDGTVLYRQRYVGAFTQPLRLRSFPFDRQTFHIELVAVRYRPNEVTFVPNQLWIRDGLRQAGGIAPYALAPGLEYSGYAFEFTASRNVQHYILKVILPLVLIVMMSWSVFWTEPTNSNTQFSIAVTSMLTLIAYRYAADSQLPRLPYMTRLDVFFLISTLLVFFSLIEVLVTTILDSNQQTARAKKIDRYCRVIVPVIFVIASIATFAHPRA